MKPKVKVFSMFLAVMLQASMFLGIVSCSVSDNNGGHESVAADTIVYRFTSQEEGKRLRLSSFLTGRRSSSATSTTYLNP